MAKYGDTPFLGDLLTIREKSIYYPLSNEKREVSEAHIKKYNSTPVNVKPRIISVISDEHSYFKG